MPFVCKLEILKFEHKYCGGQSPVMFPQSVQEKKPSEMDLKDFGRSFLCLSDVLAITTILAV